MSLVEKKTMSGDLNERLTTGGFRSTPQREHVYNVLLQKRDHPTAEEVFIRAKRACRIFPWPRFTTASTPW